MKKTVTIEQITRLYEFTREHYVEHYDLQTELVDHLANAIEQCWEEMPEMPFEDCIKAEFKKFGIFGFMDVVEKRQKALRKKYRKLIWNEVVNFFQLPKILLTGGLTLLLYFTVQSGVFPKYVYALFAFLLVSVMIFQLSKLQRRHKKQIKGTGRKWILEEMIFGVALTPFFSNIGIQLILQSYLQKWTVANPYIMFVICLVVTIFFIFCYVTVFYLPKNAEKYLNETYPEYKLA